MDAYVAAHQKEWRELEALVGARHLNAQEADRLIDLYQRVATHLSVLRSTAPDPTLVSGLSVLLDRTRRRAASRVGTWRTAVEFFCWRLPAALYHLRWWWLLTMLACVVVGVGYGVWLAEHPAVLAGIAPPEMIEQLVNHDFESYYSEYPARSFALQVWTNNALIALQCIGLGALGLPTVWILLSNMLSIGMMGALMTTNGAGELFWGLILPHGLLELTSVFVAGGAGLALFWSWVSPGNLTRSQAFAREGRRTFGIGVGLVVALAISGVIEAFVTPSTLPTWARIAIGALAWVAFMAYALVLGRKASLAGYDGHVAAEDLEDNLIAAA